MNKKSTKIVSATDSMSIDEILKRYWGYDSFRPMQREIIESVMEGRDLLALLPTGGGKSLTYQVPALALKGVAIVVTPLIALMVDQVERLSRLGIKAEVIHSGLSRYEIDMAMDRCQYGRVKLLYVAPERLTSESFLLRVNRLDVSLIAVDEAHCISHWGYDFRPSYLRIGVIREHLGSAPVLALTASATERVCNDIMEKMSFRAPNVLRGNFSRANLSYVVRECENKSEMLLRLLNNVSGSAIIYTRTRQGCERISEFLKSEGLSATYYHGGLPYYERLLRQGEWVDGSVRVIVATNAFGMGIDKSDVRLVVHYLMCDSIEAYYQEAGRAGRDGVRSYGVLLYSPSDVGRISRTIEKEFPDLPFVKECYDKICSSLMIGYGEGGGASFPFDMRTMCAKERWFSATVINAIKILQICGYLSLSDELDMPARIIFIVSRDDLYRVRINRPDLDAMIRLLLRLYDGIFTDFRAIDEAYLADRCGCSVDHIRDMLSHLWRMRVIRYIPSARTALIRMNRDRVPIEDLYIPPEAYKFRRDMSLKRYADMVGYVTNSDMCRARILIDYFGVEGDEDCGVCDVCIERRRRERQQSRSLRQGELCEQGVEREHEQQNLQSTQELSRLRGDEEMKQLIVEALRSTPQNIAKLHQAVRLTESHFVRIVDMLILDGVVTIDPSGEVSIVCKKS